jgi:hypothetical protein
MRYILFGAGLLCWLGFAYDIENDRDFMFYCSYETIEQAKSDNFSANAYCRKRVRPIEEKLTLSVDEATKMLSELKCIKVEIK